MKYIKGRKTIGSPKVHQSMHPIGFITDIIRSRHLIWSLAKSDFKNRYVGSYFGIIWEVVQPLSLIFIFWFVFEVALGIKTIEGQPYVLWFIIGLIPWFFFSDAWNNATSTFIQYSFLVKKMVFQTEVLPMVKIISSFFTSMIFHIFLIVVLVFYDVGLQLSSLAIIYFLFCSFVLVTGLSFITSSIAVFFKDMRQILTIILQFGLYLTPILWSASMIPENDQWVLYLNPMYYVVVGYRDALLHGGFILDPIPTVVFWSIALSLLLIGGLVYTRLRPHFADVL